MATGTAGTTARQYSYQMVHYLRKDFTYADTTFNIGTLPAGAIVIGAGVIVSTAFNAAGNDVLDIGTSSDGDGFATDLDLSTIGNIVWDELATSNDLGPYTADTVITGEYAYTSTAPTAGAGSVYVLFIPDNDG